MNSAGVSLIAAASPMPMPAQRVRPVASNVASVSTRASSSRFTWPKLKVSRSGSNKASRQAVRAHPYRPWRRQDGPASRRRITARAARLSSRAAAMAVRRSSRAMGSMTTAANGG